MNLKGSKLAVVPFHMAIPYWGEKKKIENLEYGKIFIFPLKETEMLEGHDNYDSDHICFVLCASAASTHMSLVPHFTDEGTSLMHSFSKHFCKICFVPSPVAGSGFIKMTKSGSLSSGSSRGVRGQSQNI